MQTRSTYNCRLWPGDASKRRRRLCQAAVISALAVTATGCLTRPAQWARQRFKVGPDYCPPTASVGEGWIDGGDPHLLSAKADYSNWWMVFNDPVLNELEAEAAAQNLQLRQAAFRIVEARALLNVARGTLWPQQQQAHGNFSRVRNSETTAIVFPTTEYDTWGVGFNASWELDIWGKFRRLVEAAESNHEAEIMNYDDVLVVLQGEVAAAYLQMRTLQERLTVVQRNVGLQEETHQLAQTRFENGKVSELDVAQASTNLNATRASVPPIEEALRKTQNALCVLLATPPASLQEDMPPGAIPVPPSDVVVGIPAELLRRRPDVRRAERQVAIQSATLGLSEAQFYPQIAITGSIGLEAENFSDLFRGESMTGSIGPGFQWNILNYGRLLNSYRAQEARFRQSVVAYQDVVLAANREVEDGIVSFIKEQERLEALQATVTAAERSAEIASMQYREGKADFLRVIDSQRELVTRQGALAESRGQVDLNLVAVYKALGGGWRTRCVTVNGVPVLVSTEVASAQGGPEMVDPSEELPLPEADQPIETLLLDAPQDTHDADVEIGRLR